MTKRRIALYGSHGRLRRRAADFGSGQATHTPIGEPRVWSESAEQAWEGSQALARALRSRKREISDSSQDVSPERCTTLVGNIRAQSGPTRWPVRSTVCRLVRRPKKLQPYSDASVV